MKHATLLACGIVVVLAALAPSARAVPLLTDVEHFGDSAGVWNNHNGANWQIWFSRDPLSNPTPTFVNIPALNNPFALNFGDNLFVMYKQDHVDPNHDHGTVFHFQGINSTGTITLTMNPTLYLGSAVIPPAAAEIILDGISFQITSYGWMDRDVFSRDRVSPNSPNPGNGLDDIGVVNIRVSPEPATLSLLALGGLGLLRRRRRQP